jgi:hypothetical protein
MKNYFIIVNYKIMSSNNSGLNLSLGSNNIVNSISSNNSSIDSILNLTNNQTLILSNLINDISDNKQNISDVSNNLAATTTNLTSNIDALLTSNNDAKFGNLDVEHNLHVNGNLSVANALITDQYNNVRIEGAELDVRHDLVVRGNLEVENNLDVSGSLEVNSEEVAIKSSVDASFAATNASLASTNENVYDISSALAETNENLLIKISDVSDALALTDASLSGLTNRVDNIDQSLNRLLILGNDASFGHVNVASDLDISGELHGPSEFIIDPRTVGDNTGTVIVKGNLQVDGSYTIVNSNEVDISDLTLKVASNLKDVNHLISTNGAGLDVSNIASLRYKSTGNGNHVWELSGGDLLGNVLGSAATLTTARNIGGVSFNGSADIDLPGVNQQGNQNTTGSAAKIASITNSDIVQLTETQTLTNKTLTAPTLTNASLGTPASGDLSNCTFPTLNQNTTGNAATATKIASITNSDIVQLTETQTLTNKTLTAPTLTAPTLTNASLGTPASGDLSNCTFPTLNQNTTGNAATATKIASITNSNIVQLTETQTLTNKTLTAPTLTAPTLTNASLGTPASGDLSNCIFPTLNQNTTGSAGSVTNGVYTVGDQTITGVKTFSSIISGDLSVNGDTSLNNLSISGDLQFGPSYQGTLSYNSGDLSRVYLENSTGNNYLRLYDNGAVDICANTHIALQASSDIRLKCSRIQFGNSFEGVLNRENDRVEFFNDTNDNALHLYDDGKTVITSASNEYILLQSVADIYYNATQHHFRSTNSNDWSSSGINSYGYIMFGENRGSLYRFYDTTVGSVNFRNTSSGNFISLYDNGTILLKSTLDQGINIDSPNYIALLRNGDVLVAEERGGNKQVWIANNLRVGANSRNETTSARLYVDGSIEATGTITSTSDDRLKHNEQNISSALSIVRKLAPQTYDMTSVFYDASYQGDISGDYNHMAGFIAQEIRAIDDLSYCCYGEEYDASGNPTRLSLDYNSIFTHGIAAIKELDSIVQAQAATIAALESRLAALEAAQ